MDAVIYNNDILIPEIAFTTLHEIFIQPNPLSDLKSIYQTAINQAVDLLGAEAVIIYQLCEGESPGLNACAAYGLPLHQIQGTLTFPADKPNFYENPSSWLVGEFWAFPENPIKEDHPFQAALGLPIRTTETSLGWLYAVRSEPPFFTPLENALFSALAYRLAENLERLSTHRRSRCLEVTAEISQLAMVRQPPFQFMKQVVNIIQNRFDFYSINLFLVEPNRKWASCRVAAGQSAQEILLRTPKVAIGGGSTLGWILESGHSSVAYLPWPTSQLFGVPLPKIASELMLALHLGGRVIGVLDINSIEPFAFQHKEEFSAFQAIADQIAQTIGALSQQIDYSLAG
jgi:GAF domain-containing protein